MTDSLGADGSGTVLSSSPAAGDPAKSLKRTTALRKLLEAPDLSFIMEAHSGLSAKIVEEAGFAGVWASGLSLSAMLGLRDNNEASWTQVLDMLEYMADATRLPILVDGDTGYGNFNNVRRLVRKLGERGLAGVCIEDKLFPKTNSFIGERQPLADIEEFCGRIRAGKDAQADDDFCIVARVEALISGHSMEEALRRAEAYHKAGADAILIHSKKNTANEILTFVKEWDNRAPVVIVPTMYHATPTEVFRRAGISTIIWANHLVRASISAMRQTAQQIQRDESLREVEGRVVAVRDIFALVGNDELEEASRRYLPSVAATRAVVLGASRGSNLGAETEALPKCMIDIRGKPLLRQLVDTLEESGVRDITVVRGYRKEAITVSGISTVDNDDYETTGEAASLACAAKKLTGETLVVYGDVLFRRYVLDGLLATKGDIVIVVDGTRGRDGRNAANPRDLVAADRRYSNDYLDDDLAQLTGIAATGEAVCGEWVGLMRVSAKGAELVKEELAKLEAEGVLAETDLPGLLDRLRRRHPVAIHYISGHWLDVDTLTDLAEARNFS